jgi:hypothetical protein
LGALYTSFYLFGVGEVVPQTVGETVMAILILIVLTIINNAIIGLFSMYSDELSAKANQLQATIDLTNTAMANLQLPHELRTEVLLFI